MNTEKKYTFFIGGYDAEMLEIKNILVQHNLPYFDKKLMWGAKVSDYKDELSNLKENEIPVLIELQIDISIPKNAVIVDHHNERETDKSSIEQLAELIEIELNRWQKLIAANDKGYIPAMEDLCASEIEIKEVRELDRKAQGVTEEDEKFAEESIEKNKTEENGIIVIKSLTDKFSPIIDRMYGKYDNLLIYTDDELTFYGSRKNQIIKRFQNLIDEKKAYYGGGGSGFFGVGKGNLSTEELKEVRDGILNLKSQADEKLYSHHIFIFPFKWKKWIYKEDSLKEKFDVELFLNELRPDNSKWKRERIKLDYFDHYNEFNYFYDYVREILYDLDENLMTSDHDDNLIIHFEYQLDKDITYNIKLFDKPITYNLEIDSILLNVYRTGTAVLSFHLRNHKYGSKEDILRINKFGRRLFVPFFDLDPDSIYTGDKDKTSEDKLLCATKKSEIPDAIWIGNKDLDKDKTLYEDFEKYKQKSNIQYGPFLLPKFIEGLFPKDFFVVNEKSGYLNNKKDTKYRIQLSPVLDDRMHLISWYGNTELVNSLNKISECNDFDLGDIYINDNREKKNRYSYEESESEESKWWYSYIFSDAPEPMNKDKFMRQRLIKESTYSRWVEWGTLYGISRFSFVILTSSFSDLEKNGATFLVRHLQSLYYKMAELCLVQRATMLSFSDEVTNVSNLIDEDNEPQSIEKISELYRHYILFVNKIYFREVTAQEQGIEIYDIMQRIMRLPSDVKDLDNEIGELNQFASMIAGKNETRAVNKLTRVATILLIPTLIAGLLGMNVLPEMQDFPSLFFWFNTAWSPFWMSIIIVLITTAICYPLLTRIFGKKFNKKKL